MIPSIDIFYRFNGKEYVSVEQYDKEIKELEAEIKKLNNIINEAIKWCEDCYCEITNVIGEKRKMISSENIIDILKGVDKE